VEYGELYLFLPFYLLFRLDCQKGPLLEQNYLACQMSKHRVIAADINRLLIADETLIMRCWWFAVFTRDKVVDISAGAHPEAR